VIRIVIPGPPPRKNAKSGTSIGRNPKTGKPMRLPAKRSKAWRARLYDALMENGQRLSTIETGVWVVRIDVYEARKTKLSCGVIVGQGDFDSCVEPVIDAMKPLRKKVLGRMVVVERGLFDDDNRIVEGTVRKHYDKANPRVEITLTRET